MSYSIQSLLDKFRGNRYDEIVSSIDPVSFSPLEQPAVANIVAAAYFKLGDFSSALTLLSDIESCFVDDIEYLILYGSCLRRIGDFDNAYIQFQRALKIDSSLPRLQNNYANLLIDLTRFDEAHKILTDLLLKNPSYDDAAANLRRLNERRQSHNLESDQVTSSQSWEFGNPLLLAFSQEEVRESAPLLKQISNSSDSKSTIAKSLPAIHDHQLATDQLKIAQQAVVDQRYDFALQLCSQVKHIFPDSSLIYECASDAYIAKKMFNEAEICILHALQLGTKSFKLIVNLISLACMRRDFHLAHHYFEVLLSMDSEHSFLPRLREQIQQGLKKYPEDSFRFDMSWSIPDVSRKSD